MAQSWRDRLRRGEYPHLVEAREREILEASQKARGAAPTVAELAALFRDRYLVTNTRRPASRLIAFNKWVAPELGAMKLADVKRRDLNQVLEKVEDAGKHVTANSLARILGQMFRWAVDRAYLTDSPAERLSAGRSHTEGSRVLTEDEIRSLWSTLDRDDLPMSTVIRLGLRVLLLTGARSGELVAAKWEDVAYTGKMPQWLIPAQATKGERSHLVPLGPSSARLFKAIHELTGDSGFVMPQGERVRGQVRLRPRKTVAKEHLDSHAIATALRRTITFLKDRSELQFEPFGAHDLRRTLRTGLSRLGISADLAERVIGHAVRNRLVSTYDTYDRLKERRDALIEWDVEVQRILAETPARNAARSRQNQDARKPKP